MGIAVTLHDSHGVSFESAQDHVLQIILFRSHTHIHFKISNVTDQGLMLWRPYCPNGDTAMSIEFREASAPEKVIRARTGFDYTGGMGNPKVFILAPRNDLIVNVDFQGGWILPLALEVDQIRELEIRALYRSEPLKEADRNLPVPGIEKVWQEIWKHEMRKMEEVWTGVASSNWEKVRIINRTGERFERKR